MLSQIVGPSFRWGPALAALSVVAILGSEVALPDPEDGVRKILATAPGNPAIRPMELTAGEKTLAQQLSAQESRKRDEELKALVEALRGQIPKLGPLLNDKDPEICLAANQALEAVAESRVRLKVLRQAKSDERPKGLDDVLGAPLRALLPLLAKELTHKDVRIRLAALYVLETLEDEATPAAAAVAGALRDQDAFVRWGAARSLQKIAPREGGKAIPALMGTAEDPNGDVRITVLAVLGRYGPAAQAAVPVLMKALGRGDAETRIAAARALGKIGTEAAVPALVDALAAKEVEVRVTVIRALYEIGPAAKGAREAFIKALSDPDAEVRREASDALLSNRKVDR